MCRISKIECDFGNGKKATMRIPNNDILNRNLYKYLVGKKENGTKTFHFNRMSLSEGNILDFKVETRSDDYPETRSTKKFRVDVSFFVPHQEEENTVVLVKYSIPKARIVNINQVTSEVKRDECFLNADLEIPYGAASGIKCTLVDNEDD